MAKDPERRRGGRKDLFSEVTLHFASGKYQARISDLSVGGCYVDSIASVSKGDEITLTLINVKGETKDFSAEIAYTVPGVGFGVSFKNLSPAQYKFLQQLI
jgi:hypothetical protein